MTKLLKIVVAETDNDIIDFTDATGENFVPFTKENIEAIMDMYDYEDLLDMLCDFNELSV